MSVALELSAPAQSKKTSEHAELDRALLVLKENATKFARLSPKDKAQLLRETVATTFEVGEAWGTEGAKMKQLPADHGEDFFTGPVPTLRNLRLLAEQLESINNFGRPKLDARQIHTRPDGRVEIQSFPTSGLDGAMFAGIKVSQLIKAGVDAKTAQSSQAGFYQKKDPLGGVSLILGAGNVSAIPPMDALYKGFAEGFVCAIKMNPVNEWAGPFIERAFKPFIDRGFMRVVYGSGDVGKYLVEHPIVEDIHITGSNHTHDLIVWGPAGPERERRIKENDPLLKKTITSELGNVSPVVIVPAEYAPNELEYVAQTIRGMITNNASFNCNAAKMLVTSKAWKQRDELLRRLGTLLAETPTRFAYYPGAHDRFRTLTKDRAAKTFGSPNKEQLPWGLITDVDASNKSDPLFSTEPFCSLLSETSLAAGEPAAFIREAQVFLSETLWGTLNAMFFIPPKTEAQPEVNQALDRAILELEYGTVAINQWPALVFALVSPAWGGHPSATLADVQSGIGWVHNTYLLEHIDKSVLRGPMAMFPKPVFYPDHKNTGGIGRRLLGMEKAPSWLRVPGIIGAALKG